ncbi:MAG: ribose-phosphate pyrophosphokinase [Candidatus Nitrohelix vancouverensis]|uniref:Ribose-phosphate pyrophosphokinase n=1 Tax=Candidatus Nitrohelix vancouverensis TaxID=2705534 RepID=A0A7T0C0W7_9BACT|nr:MAG: ribose-phosphate pyrophosphokinase [Candidatus Nitrohelix vancouverensis]
MSNANGRPLVFSGRANRELTADICKYMKIPIGQATIKDFSDREIFVRIEENVRGADVFIIQSTCYPGNTNLMELLIMMDAFRRSSAKRITAVLPYYGYARQDRKTEPRVPITSKLIADLLQSAGADRVLTVDLHAGQIQGFFNIPVDHLYAVNVLIQYIQGLDLKDLVVISPDAGGVERARAYAKRLGAPIAIIDKRREAANIAKAMNIIGDVKGQRALIVDDMIDTGGTLMEATDALLNAGALEVHACCTHPVLSGPAGERIQNSPIKSVIATNTIPLNDDLKKIEKIKILSVASLLGEAILRINCESSVSSLFD